MKKSRTQIKFESFNKQLPLIEVLVPLVGDKKEVKIADIGSGPFSMVGSTLEGVKIELHPSDNQDFSDFWKSCNLMPIFPVEYQNMEELNYPNEFFDIVHSQNALDHTKNAKKAVEEMIRVCKKGGAVYIKCWLDQLSTGYKHYWNAKQDGVFDNNYEKFDLKDYGFKIEFTDLGGESRYNQITAILQK